MRASCWLSLNSSTPTSSPGGVSGCDTEVVGALRPSGDDPHCNFMYCVQHATHTDWRDQAEDDHGPDSRDGRKSVFRDRTIEGRCTLPGEKQADSRHCPALRFFQAPAVMAHPAPNSPALG